MEAVPVGGQQSGLGEREPEADQHLAWLVVMTAAALREYT
jgi:hypothetical protein